MYACGAAQQKKHFGCLSTAWLWIRSVLSPSAPAELNTSSGHSAAVKSDVTDRIMKDRQCSKAFNKNNGSIIYFYSFMSENLPSSRSSVVLGNDRDYGYLSFQMGKLWQVYSLRSDQDLIHTEKQKSAHKNMSPNLIASFPQNCNCPVSLWILSYQSIKSKSQICLFY